MKLLLKISFSVLFFFALSTSFARSPQASGNGQTSQVKKDKPAAEPEKKKKGDTAAKNKIAVSDQAQPSQKSTKKTAKKDNGATNK